MCVLSKKSTFQKIIEKKVKKVVDNKINQWYDIGVKESNDFSSYALRYGLIGKVQTLEWESGH